MKRTAWLTIPAFILLTLALRACVPEPCDWETHDPLIVAGKAHMGASEVYEGYEAFADAWAVCPDSADARMGLALSCQLEMERSFYAIVEAFMGNFFGSPASKRSAAPGARSIGTIVQSLLLNHFLPKVEELLCHARGVQEAPPGWSFYVEPYPFMVEGEFVDRVIIDMSGEWDHSDALILEAEAELYRGLIHFLCAFDFTLDGYWTMHMPDAGGDPVEAIHNVAEWFLNVLDDPNYPDLLTLQGAAGAEHMRLAGLSWGRMYLKFHEGTAAMLAETDDPSDDVSGYVDQNGNGRWDEGEPFFIPYIGALSEDQNWFFTELLDLFLSFGRSTLDGTDLDVHPQVPDVVWLSELNFVLQALGLAPVLPPLPINFGPYYTNPNPCGVKEALRAIAQFLYDVTAPGGEAAKVGRTPAGKGVTP